MFPSAPDVEVYAPNVLFIGRNATVEIVVHAKKQTNVDFIEARVSGHQGWHLGGGNNSVYARAVYPELKARLMEKGVLETGTRRFTTTFALPEAMAPSHELAPAWGRLDLRVHVSIPWWPDGRYRFRLPVRLPAPGEVTRKPFAMRSTRSDAAADNPRLEISLASTRLIVGEVVVGSCAVFHVDDSRPRDVDVDLVPSFKLIQGGRLYERRGGARRFRVSIPAKGAGTSVPFRFQLPKDIVPSFTTITHQLEWWLIAKTGSFFGRSKQELAVPLEIFDASAAATTARLETAPRLSDARVETAFTAFAERHGWHTSKDDDDEAQLAIEREHRGTVLRIGYDYRGKDGTFLVGRIAHPLGLGLSVSPSSSLRELLTNDIAIDIETWDRAHHVEARSRMQAVPFLTAIVPAVMTAMRTLGPLARWTDDEIVFAQAIATVDERDLLRTSSGLGQLADDLLATEVAPPPELVVDIDAWRRLAKRLQGELTPGDLTIEGKLDQMPAAVGLQFDEDGQPRRIRAYVGDPNAVSERLAEAKLTEEHTPDWPSDFVELHYDRGIASAALALTGEHAAADATRTFELVQALRGVLARLDPAPGPYR